MDKIISDVNRLILKIKGGEVKALDELFELTSGMLLAMAKKYLRDKSLADDVVSETYIRLVRYSSNFDKSKNGLNYLYKIVRNVSYDINFATSREGGFDEDVPEGGDFASDALGSLFLESAVEKLNDDDRQLLYLRFWEGLRLREIADRLDIRISTAHSRLKAALKILKNALDKEDGNVDR